MQRTGCVIAVIWCFLVAGVWSQQPGEARVAVVKANNGFTNKLFKTVDRDSDGNTFFSPLSIETLLALTWLGAGGQTAKQIAEGLNLPPNTSRQHVEEGFRELLTHLKNTTGNITLDIANKIFTKQGFDIGKDFHKTAEENFLSEVQEVDFERNSETARITINQWVEDKTHNRIKDLLAKGIIGSETAVVLVNAIYFKGSWETPFDPNRTEEMTFHVNSTLEESVQMMINNDYYNYTELPELDTKVIQLPYEGGELSMLVLLPNDIDGLPKLEDGLPTLDINNLVENMERTDVHLALPKFKLEMNMHLDEVLMQLGMTDMFRYTANFSGLPSCDVSGFTECDFKVSKVVQKTFLEVTEEGSEAAAATGEVLINFYGEDVAIFHADHPFIFLIRENSSGAIIFAGIFSGPQSPSGSSFSKRQGEDDIQIKITIISSHL